MKIVMDACTVILLAKASVLESAAKSFDLIMPRSVYEEVMAGKEKKFPDAFLTERLTKEKLMLIMEIENKTVREIIKYDFGMGYGEADTITLQLQEGFDAVATDNKKGREAARIYNAPLIGSPEIIISLFKMKKISEEKAKQAFAILKKEGWFNEVLLERLMEEINAKH